MKACLSLVLLGLTATSVQAQTFSRAHSGFGPPEGYHPQAPRSYGVPAAPAYTPPKAYKVPKAPTLDGGEPFKPYKPFRGGSVYPSGGGFKPAPATEPKSGPFAF